MPYNIPDHVPNKESVHRIYSTKVLPETNKKTEWLIAQLMKLWYFGKIIRATRLGQV